MAGRSDQEMHMNCPSVQYKEVYEKSQSHFHAFVNIVRQHNCTHVSCAQLIMLLQ